jgi:hypothetical protein
MALNVYTHSLDKKISDDFPYEMLNNILGLLMHDDEQSKVVLNQ